MPPQLPALCAPAPASLLARAFSSSAAALTASSTSSLSSIHGTDRRGGYRGAPRQPVDSAADLLTRYRSRVDSSARNKQAQLDLLRNRKDSTTYLRQMPRRFEAGDVYSPHDLSPVEMQKWRKRAMRQGDIIDALGLRPLDMYKNFSLIQDFTSTSGQIIHSSGTSLRPVNQRKIAKMVRRSQGMGIYPTVHDHPELIRDYFFAASS